MQCSALFVQDARLAERQDRSRDADDEGLRSAAARHTRRLQEALQPAAARQEQNRRTYPII